MLAGTVPQVAGLYGDSRPSYPAMIGKVGETSKVSGARDWPFRLFIAWISSAELSSSPSLVTLIPCFFENWSLSGPSLAQSGGSPTTLRCPSFCACLIRPARPSEPSAAGRLAEALDPPPQASRKLAIEPNAIKPAAPRPPRRSSSRLETLESSVLSMSYMRLPPAAARAGGARTARPGLRHLRGASTRPQQPRHELRRDRCDPAGRNARRRRAGATLGGAGGGERGRAACARARRGRARHRPRADGRRQAGRPLPRRPPPQGARGPLRRRRDDGRRLGLRGARKRVRDH